MEAKVGVGINNVEHLIKINKNISLQENINAICSDHNLKSPTSYALKFSVTTGTFPLNDYVTEDNFYEIKDGQTFELTKSLEIVINTIFVCIKINREEGYDKLYHLGTDPGFVKQLVKLNRDKDINNLITTGITGRELSACLITLLHLLKKRYIHEINYDVLSRIISCIKSESSETPPNEQQYALAVVCQLLYMKDTNFNAIKHTIIGNLGLDDLTPFLWSEEHPSLQLNAIMLINAIVKSVKDTRRTAFLKEMNSSKNRGTIFKYIIRTNKIDDQMARQLYLYQTHIFSLYENELNYRTEMNDLISREFDNGRFNLSRCNSTADNQLYSRNRHNSTDTILEEDDNLRISLASMESERSNNTMLSDELSPRESVADDQNSEKLFTICQFTISALMHYQRHHSKQFNHSKLEENSYGPGLYKTAECITNLLKNVIHIGCNPVRNNKSYHPLVFNTDIELPFVYELFSKIMYLLSKTRQEMKAFTQQDFNKVLRVLEKQIEMILKEKPMDYKSLNNKMRAINYEVVATQWEKEKDEEWRNMFEKHPIIQELKTGLVAQNEKLIYEQRIRILQIGAAFPKLPEKKGKQQHFSIYLSENKRIIYWGNWNDHYKEFLEEPITLSVADIKYLVTGKACPHIKDHTVNSKFHDRVFSLIFEGEDTLNFLADDKNMANNWIDAFNLLLRKQDRSENYDKELNMLVEIDCALHLLELENIPIPTKAPPVPPLPPVFMFKPKIPPKSPSVTQNLMARRTISKNF